MLVVTNTCPTISSWTKRTNIKKSRTIQNVKYKWRKVKKIPTKRKVNIALWPKFNKLLKCSIKSNKNLLRIIIKIGKINNKRHQQRTKWKKSIKILFFIAKNTFFGNKNIIKTRKNSGRRKLNHFNVKKTLLSSV